MAKKQLTPEQKKMKAQRREKVKGWSFVIGAVLLAIKIVLEKVWGIEIPNNFYDSLVTIILAVGGPFGALRNNYILRKGIKQFHVLWNSRIQ